MLNRTTLARPYARAVFEVARDAGRLAEWSNSLSFAAAVASSPDIQQFSGDPRVGREQLLALIMDLGGDRFDESMANFLKVLMNYDRLELLPEIAAQYEFYRREAEARLKVQVSSAMPMSDEESDRLVERLKARFGRDIDLQVDVDESLIGGAVIRAGDQVIDGSVRGRLEQLGRQLAR
ncbi:F0F1 ATP synthase subunit delta [Wenzhouxiangella marina]|uniref:ATP synthase subunit delta n=1 Tax=Wenzhouxiangella marina TaxID=1579979 RepID=A0A0K0XS45_9GAMM|nr:F0F1 ATP synthase subunit delta [Wenzhouxiangella marina]AKS40534.1 ATP synthase subunit delta [Wenzhouxiangella marina]MBB6088142.1 F-type H+-transporting ATPase subunit delta [Wenzhouxiangella marina]